MIDRATQPSAPRALTRQAVASALVWTALGVLNVVLVSLLVPLPGAGQGARLERHLFDLGHHVLAGVASGAVVFFASRHIQTTRHRSLLTYGVALAIGAATLGDDFPGLLRHAGELTGWSAGALQALKVACVAASIPAAWALGQWLSHGWRRVAALMLFALAYGGNCVLSPYDNRGAHLFLSWAGVALVTPALASLLPRFHRRRHRLLAVGAAVTFALASLSVVLPPSNSARIALLRWHASVLAPFVRHPSNDSEIPLELVAKAGPFFEERKGAPPVPPSAPPLADDPIVVLITIDALRADLFTKQEHAEYVETLHSLKQRGTYFSEARAPGSQTVYTLSSISTGKHFSQQYWSRFRRELWPHEEEGPHFAEVLQRAEVHTAMARPLRFLGPRYGIMRGFEDAELIKGKHRYAYAPGVTDRLLSFLESEPSGPTFIYAHYMDPHKPYDRGGKEGTQFDRYLREVRIVDEHIGQLVDAIEDRGLAERTTLIVTADHGEAFGEHNSKYHSSTLYEELIHVPLIVFGPSIPERQVDTPASLMDLGPTVLDLFGVPTPGHFMGQSLVPFFRGEDPPLHRPIVAEGRLKQAMVFDDGVKVIRDLHAGTLEVYDLHDDPEELHNLADELTPRLRERVTMLQLFFDVHTLDRDGYEVPMRK